MRTGMGFVAHAELASPVANGGGLDAQVPAQCPSEDKNNFVFELIRPMRHSRSTISCGSRVPSRTRCVSVYTANLPQTIAVSPCVSVSRAGAAMPTAVASAELETTVLLFTRF